MSAAAKDMAAEGGRDAPDVDVRKSAAVAGRGLHDAATARW